MLQLRQYQRESIDALYDYWRAGGGDGLIVLPTGAGKSLVLAMLMKELHEQYPTLRIACVTHSRELIVQNFQELMRNWPGAPAGIYSAGVGRRDTHHPILFCGIQSVWRKVRQIGKVDLLLVDEVHLISRRSSSMYGKFIAALRDITPDMRIAGLTATPFRLDSGRLDDGDDAMFSDIVYDVPVTRLIDEGYLSPLVSKASLAKINLNGIGTRAGDFIQSQMEEAAMKDGLVDRAVSELVQFGQDRRAWLAFCASVDHARAVRDAVRAHGIACEMVDGTMAKGERDGIIQRFKDGQLRCLTSVNVLSIGFNVPHVDLIALMRGTKSAGLYIQQVGRGFRKAEGKDNCAVLDFASVVRMHGPVDDVNIMPSKKSGGGDKVSIDTVRAKECPDCLSLVALNASVCKICGHEWPRDEKPTHEAEADATTGILSTEAVPPKQLPVVEWHFNRHQKAGSPDSVRVTYTAGLSLYNEWLAFEHHGFPAQKAAQWWSLHRGQFPVPKTVDDALARLDELSRPQTISVKPRGRYFDIIGRSLPAANEEAA